MTRKFLEEMGLDKEKIDRILDENSSDIGRAKGELENITKERDNLKSQISERDKQLTDLKKSSGDNEELKKQIEALQQQNTEQKNTFDSQMAQLKLENAVNTALTAAGAKNNKAVMALLDMSGVKLDDNGALSGFDEALETVRKSDSFLFADKSQTFKGFQPGQSSDVNLSADTSNMTYSEMVTYLNSNPNAKIE